MSFREPPPVPNVQYAKLPQELKCPIAYTLSKLSNSGTEDDDAILVLFVNGLGVPQAFWQPTIELLKAESQFGAAEKPVKVYAATYDRYGQGLSKTEDGEPPNRHDLLYSVTELETIRQFIVSKIPENKAPKLFIIAHSVGVVLTRLYCQHHPGKVTAALFLDSNMANTDFVSLVPDPDAPNFDPQSLPSDTTPEQLRTARDFFKKMFHPAAPNPENLDRSAIPSMLPDADSPKLAPPNHGGKLFLTVAGHDTDTFVEESLKISTAGITLTYVEPLWKAYNKSLLQLVDKEDGEVRGVLSAPVSGHFIQINNPRFVADEITHLVGRIADHR